ncbi:MFS transporter [Streptomyces sp. NPDC088354]|uniref:MFS transporter n=1 Tax=Streptomyces sp. NPDC088354 TaxID=3365856 RepID=UPI00382BAEEF
MTALLPDGRPQRLLAAATTTTMLGYGIYLTAGVLYLTRGLHLPAAQVGLGMSVAGAVSLALGVPIGHLADRVGARMVYPVTLAVGCLSMVGLCLTRDLWAFVVFATLNAVAQAAGPAARAPLVQKYGGDRPAEFRSYLRAVTNLGIAGGSVVAAWAIERDTRTAYVLIIGASAVSYAVGALTATMLPSLAPLRSRPGPRWVALRDRPYVAITILDGLMAVQYRVLSVALPLWLLGRTSAPPWAVSAVMLLNTALVVLFQVRGSKGIDSVPAGAAAFRRAGLAFLVACGAMSLLPGLPSWAVVVVLLAAVTAHTVGEIWQAAGGFELSFALAPKESVGQYQGLFGMGLGLGTTLGPSVLIALCIGQGKLGWWIVGAGFALTGLAVPPVTRWAQRSAAAPLLQVDGEQAAPADEHGAAPSARAADPVEATVPYAAAELSGAPRECVEGTGHA